MEISPSTVLHPGELSEIREGSSGEQKCGTAGPLPHWIQVKDPAFYGGSKTPRPLESTVPMPKRALSVLRPPPPPTHTDPVIRTWNEAMEAGNEPPEDDTPASSADTPTEDKRDGPSGPPGPLLPVDRWTVDKTRISLNEHVEREARSRSRPRRANETDIASQRMWNALITFPDVQPQGFGTCLEPYDSRVGASLAPWC